MTGLMVKDFLVMRKSIKTYILFLAFYFVMAALGIFPISFITAMVQIIIMMLPLSAFSYDELSKWDRYAFSLPLGRRAVAGARYLFALSLALFAALFGLVSCLVLSGFFHDPNLVENCLTVMVSLGLGLLYCDILLPLTYKLGPERARPYFCPSFSWWEPLSLECWTASPSWSRSPRPPPSHLPFCSPFCLCWGW